MTTSDSEDFESADEEIDPDPSVSLPKSKNHVEHEIHSGGKVEPDPDACVSKSEIPVEPKSAENKTANLTDEERGVVDQTVHVDVKSDASNQSSSRSERNRRPQKNKENKVGPMKLGVRVTPSRDLAAENLSLENVEKPSSNAKKATEMDEVLADNNVGSDADVHSERELWSSPSDSIPEAHSRNIVPEFENKVEQQQPQPAEKSSGWGFGKSLIGSSAWSSVGGWGSSLLNSASLSVSTLGSHVTQGISTVLETVEAGIGAPSPEELAMKLKEEEELKKAEEKDGTSIHKEDEGVQEGELEMDDAWGDWRDDDQGEGQSGTTGTGLFSLVSGVTQVTGKVLSTGLGTLETIGKKTMEVLQEGDPGLKKKRALLLGNDDTVILSQVLREAKEKAEAEALLAEEKEAMRKAHFETLFDDFQGLVHLEALEMLSRQSDLRLKSLLLKETGPALRALQIRLAAVQEMCEIPEHDEEEESTSSLTESLPEALKSLKIGISAEKVIMSCKESFEKLEEMKKESEGDNESKVTTRIIHQEAITALATLTANSIELFHKVTELLLVKEGKGRDVKEEAKTMAEITASLTSEVNKIAAAYSDFLSAKLSRDSLSAEDKEKIESSITSIFLEASNSSTYIQDAFQLMVPILQCGAVA